MLINLKRVFRFAFTDFYRNKGMSVAAIFVLVITISLLTGLFFLHGVNTFLVKTIQEKIDITAYFKSDTSEQDILNVKDELIKDSPEIKSIEYVSKADALAIFNERHADNSVFSSALTEIGDNPFLPALNIRTFGDPAQYQQIANILNQPQFSNLIEKVDFSQKKDTIEKVFSITSAINTFGLMLAILLTLVVILVVFNTIKLVIDASKEEIATQRLVGASSWFVRAPFVIEGALFGVISFILCFLIAGFTAYFLAPALAVIMPGFNLFNYFLSNMLLIAFIQLGGGVALGVVSSFIVVRKYLKV